MFPSAGPMLDSDNVPFPPSLPQACNDHDVDPSGHIRHILIQLWDLPSFSPVNI